MVNATPRPLYPRESASTQCRGVWVGLRGRSGRTRKISPPPGFYPRTVCRVASRCTDWAIAVPKSSGLLIISVKVKENFPAAPILFSILRKILRNRWFMFFCDLSNDVSEEPALSTSLLKSSSHLSKYTSTHLRSVCMILLSSFLYVM